MGRNHWLDFLKLTFILVIAFLHTAWWTSMKYGFLPVEFFFIVSGFYVYVSYAFKRYKFGKFIIKKIMRVFPAYLLILLIYAGYSLAFPQFYSESSYDHWGLSFIRELFMLQGVGLTELFHVRCMVILQSAWYVSVYFYGAILLYWLLVNVTRKVAICIFSVIVIGVYGFFFLLWGSTLEIWTYKGFFYMPLWRGLAGMSAGILLGMALRRENVAGWLATHKFFFNILSIVALAGAFYSFFSPTDIEWVGIICFICILANAVSPDGIGSYFNKWGGNM